MYTSKTVNWKRGQGRNGDSDAVYVETKADETEVAQGK
jgi:hypothetical protein